MNADIRFKNKTKLLSVKKYKAFIQEAAIEDELTECRKSVYVAETNVIQDKLDYLTANYLTLNFYALKFPLFGESSGWIFPPIQL